MKGFDVENNKLTILKVIDNGKGILREEIESIFMPFYSTKENGSPVFDAF